ncbi:hypothetical protein IW261DRAFT_1567300 [Armillaria novae-zelandiae]|uniref:Uncharacterized protein n=1 Tax=Armillaria novae-zelandiae TaxID=153914 RepID=A0AA39P1X2_9AGAR|nr:hypothetical protein IW261DRAFT_1567300 [Armillaria novae-zelandiae]
MAVATAKCIACPPADPCSLKQWACTNLPTKATGYLNPRWPGCCHPPVPPEHHLIQPVDWQSISIIHHIHILSDIKATLDSLCPAIPWAPTKPMLDRKASPPMSKSPAMPPKSPVMPSQGSCFAYPKPDPLGPGSLEKQQPLKYAMQIQYSECNYIMAIVESHSLY